MRISVLLAGFLASSMALSTSAGEEKQVLWGDTHVHTANSLDARAFGVLLDPEQAYRFARGEEDHRGGSGMVVERKILSSSP